MSSQVQILKYESLASTNSFAHQLVAEDRPQDETVIWALEQSSGRGQRNNAWVVEPGKNLTFSIIIYPSYLPINRQFALSEATALAITDVLANLIPNKNVAIKWPNDIYVGDKKIGGLLLEHSIMGTAIDYSIVGIGININQVNFPANLPNPTSLAIETNAEYDLGELLEAIIQAFYSQVERIRDGRYSDTHNNFKQMLYRNEGYHLFETERGQFSAKIADVKQTGELVLELDNGSQTAYAFKEVAYVI